MKYKNGVKYTFNFGGNVVCVTLRNFGPHVVENFNKTLAEEKVKAFQRKGVNNLERFSLAR